MIATAISELSRDVVLEPGGGRVDLALSDDHAALVITIVGLPVEVAASEALAAAGRLMSEVVVTSPPTKAECGAAITHALNAADYLSGYSTAAAQDARPQEVAPAHVLLIG